MQDMTYLEDNKPRSQKDHNAVGGQEVVETYAEKNEKKRSHEKGRNDRRRP